MVYDNTLDMRHLFDGVEDSLIAQPALLEGREGHVGKRYAKPGIGPALHLGDPRFGLGDPLLELLEAGIVLQGFFGQGHDAYLSS